MISITADKLPNMHSTDWRGIPVVIQWPKGSTRVGERKNGEPFKIEMKADYGYIPATVDIDADDHLDVYIGPHKDSEYAYVLEQMQDGEFDEYKIMLGYESLEEAEASYLEHLPEEMLGDITEVPFEYLFDAYKKEEPKGIEDEPEVHEERAEKHKQGDQERIHLIDAFVKLYKHEFDYFQKVADEVHDQLSEALQEAGIRAIVTYRAKKPRKLKAKLLKRNETHSYQSFQDIYDDVVDLAGVRVALYLPADRTAVGQLIEQAFTLMRPAKNFPEDRQQGDGIGYVATHYLVRLKPETLHKEEYQYAETNVEIQVASVLMHAWAEVTHDLLYKPEKGTLTAEEYALITDLNNTVQEGEGILERLQQSVENRQQHELRFELTSALTKLAEMLAMQSEGHALRRITASDVEAVAKRAMQDNHADLMQFMKDLGWNYAENDNWSDPVKPQEQIQVFHDGWMHRAWDEIKGNGNNVQELQQYLGEAGLSDAKHPHKLPEQPPLPPHVSYLQAKLASWKAHSK